MKKTLHLLFFILLSVSSFAQTPGLIYVPPGGMGATPLNPNGDAWSSVSTSGYVANDIAESDIVYQPLPVPYAEPIEDLARGADCSFSDIVRLDTFDSGVYMYSDATNLLFRFRQGSTVPGSKGYSILIDTDMRFGCCGANADPNYIPKTTGINGNPGFEIEIVLETNFQVAVYDVDGVDFTTVPSISYPYGTHSQRSVAITNNCDDPDYFHDFYVVLADLYSTFGITASTPLRYAATTVMAPTSAIGGPLSDINGGGSFEDIINYQCGTPIGTTPTTGAPCSCTNPPSINGPIPSGTNVPITGNWNNAGPLTPSSADIEVFLNGYSQGTTTATDGAGWSMTLPGPLVNGDTIYATAQASGEGVCDPDPQIIIVSDCVPANTPPTPTIDCIGAKGIRGFSEPNAIIEISLFLGPPSSGDSLMVTITANATGTWGWDGLAAVNDTANNVCNSGSGDMPEGTYMISASNGSCPALDTTFCYDRNGGGYPLSGSSTEPVITTNPIEEGNSDIEGTAVDGEYIRLYINGFYKTMTTCVGGTFRFTDISPLYAGDIIEITAQSSTVACQSTFASSIVSCSVAAPGIDANLNSEVSEGSALSGTSTENGGTINIYDLANPTVSLGTATVSSGTWTSSVLATAGITYFATVSTACGNSDVSLYVDCLPATPDRCGTFTSAPHTETDVSVSGTLTTAIAGTIVNLYADGSLIGTTTTGTTSWTVNVTSGELYGGATLTFGIKEPGAVELICSATDIVQCTPPPLFNVSPTSVTVPAIGQTATFNLSSTTAGILYAIEEAALPNADQGISVFSTGADFTMETTPFLIDGIFNYQIKAMTFDGKDCETIIPITITVVNTLPIELILFEAELINKTTALLTWSTSSETDNKGFEIQQAVSSSAGFEFIPIGFVTGAGTSLDINNYEFEVPNLPNGINYFRLKQVDFSGDFAYSNVEALEVSLGGIESVYPNIISENNDKLYCKVVLEDNYQIDLVNTLGQVEQLYSGRINADTFFPVSIQREKYSAGIYYLRISNQDNEYVSKILIK